METRYNYLWIWLGTNKVGKTPTAIKVARAYKRFRPDNDIYCFDPRGSIREAKYVNPKTGREELLVKKEHLIRQGDIGWAENLLGIDIKTRKQIKPPKKNYMLLLDDFQGLCPNYKTPQGFRDILSMLTEYNIDAIGITHTPKNILEGIAEQVTDYSIFYNNARSISFADKIMNFEKCQEASRIVNEYCVRYGLGTYPIFPYAHINKYGKMDLVNMEAEKLRHLKCLKNFKLQ